MIRSVEIRVETGSTDDLYLRARVEKYATVGVVREKGEPPVEIRGRLTLLKETEKTTVFIVRREDA